MSAMSRLLPAVSLAVALVALGLSLRRPPQPPVQPSAPPGLPSAAVPEEEQELARRLDALEEELDHVLLRTRALEQRPLVAADGRAAEAPAALADEVVALRRQVQELAAGEALRSEDTSAALKELVRSVQEEMRAERRQAYQQQSEQARLASLREQEELWRRFVSEARLDSRQEQELMRRLGEEEALRESTRQEVQDGRKSPRDAIREVRSARKATDEAMRQLLTEEQLARFRALRPGERESFPGILEPAMNRRRE